MPKQPKHQLPEYLTFGPYMVNGKQEKDTFCQITKSLMLSEAYRQLTERQKNLLTIAYQQAVGRSKPCQKYPDANLPKDSFFLTFDEVRMFGAYGTDRNGFYKKDIPALIEHGFIDLVSKGAYGKQSIYKYSSRWKRWNQEIFSLTYNQETKTWDYHSYT